VFSSICASDQPHLPTYPREDLEDLIQLIVGVGRHVAGSEKLVAGGPIAKGSLATQHPSEKPEEMRLPVRAQAAPAAA
jgi:hypothetical protein